jgi:thiamine-phosphate pyrophosphorylase
MHKDSSHAVFRILDASANRVGEGLRTVEEWARFALDNETLSAELKAIRHQVSTALAILPRTELLTARDTSGDVGTKITQDTERIRHCPSDVLAAGVSRTGQSLRVMEEYLKTINVEAAATIEQARYRFYTASASLELLAAAQDRSMRVQQTRLYALIDAGTDEAEFQERVTTLCEAGVDILQLRESSQSDRTLIARARMGVEIARNFSTLFIMNDRADLAIAADCDGVHLGQDELPALDARKMVGHDRIVGISTHSIDQAIQAVADGADYIGCGPVFPSRTKSFDQFAGLEYIRQVSKQIDLPAFAIGGIDESNLDQVIDAGCCRVAVTAALRHCNDVTDTATRIKNKLLKAIVSGN